MAISERLGVGRVKHLEIKSLWLQERVKMNGILPKKVPTADNEAYLNTKVHPAPRFIYLMGLLGLKMCDASDRQGSVVGGTTGSSISKEVLALATALSAVVSARGEVTTCPAIVCTCETSETRSAVVTLIIAIVAAAALAAGWWLGKRQGGALERARAAAEWTAPPAAPRPAPIYGEWTAPPGAPAASGFGRPTEGEVRDAQEFEDELTPSEFEAIFGRCATGTQTVEVAGPPQAILAGRTVQTQSQVRYTWGLSRPRFTPLPDYAQGCWQMDGQ